MKNNKKVTRFNTPAPPVPTPPAPAPSPAPQLQMPSASGDEQFSAAQVRTMIEKAREEARHESNDRLYSRLEATTAAQKEMEAEVARLRAVDEERQQAEQSRLDEIANQEKAAQEAEMSAKELAETVRAEAQAQIAQLRQEQETERAIFAKEREHQQVELYRERRVAEERDNIEDNLIDLVSGNTVEEVEASIATLKAKSAAILESVQQAQIANRATMPGVSSNAGNTGPLEQLEGQPQELTPEEIVQLPWEDPRYQALRAQHGMSAAPNPMANGGFPDRRAVSWFDR